MVDIPTYVNPVYPGSFADPFVLCHGDWYDAYGTDSNTDASAAFEVLRSRDLVTWDRHHTARRMYVDRIAWTADGPRTDGPTASPRPVPGGRILNHASGEGA